MNIAVCVKQVPEVADEELEINEESTDIEKEDLVFSINEWDNYAVEEAVRIKEQHGGRVTVITVGDEESEDVLRRCLAMGADQAILVDDPALSNSDAQALSLVLSRVLEGLDLDLVMTGVQAGDDGFAQTGVALAERLNLPYASLVTRVEVLEGRLRVERELEAGLAETVELALPALITVQSGINEPRYVSIMGIRKVRGLEINKMTLQDLGLEASQVGEAGSWFEKVEMSLPPEGEGAQILEGSLEEVCRQAAAILKEKGGLS